ncbi:ATP-binding protein [Ferrovibrio xuzhouensis]|uniref:ATP-binding protein n=1 Tax=Ferrovibrio xuzhouensis TaxID=1576914 RepID=A0ABV7VJ36_9PROT
MSVNDMDIDLAAWNAGNRAALAHAIDGVRRALARHAGRVMDAPVPPVPEGGPYTLDILAERFDLSAFEQAVVVLCIGMEIDAGMAQLCATAVNDASRPFPTFGLAVAALPGGHWNAAAPGRPLRHWLLLDTDGEASLQGGHIRLNERIVHFLLGGGDRDARLAAMSERIPEPPLEDVPPAHRPLARQVAALMAGRLAAPLPCLDGPVAAVRGIAAAAAAGLGLPLYAMPADSLASQPDLDLVARLWEREVALLPAALLLDAGDRDAADPLAQAVLSLAERITTPLVLAGGAHLRPRSRIAAHFTVPLSTAPERRAQWQAALAKMGLGADMADAADVVADQFELDAPAMRACSQAALDAEGRLDVDALWSLARAQARRPLNDLAEVIEPRALMDDLVVPGEIAAILAQIVAAQRQRTRVLDDWGFAARNRSGLGLSVLFAGPSGTGKSMAAEAIATALRLDLCRIDLSAVVSKYIGETEKNLRHVFDAAEASGAVLLFDEADALFGKRSEVRDSHDRHANIEVGYLLQRVEAYRGVAVLTTNLRSSLDPAFLRRLRFILDFSFPDQAARVKLWQRAFPRAVPLGALDHMRLARLNLAGGSIANIALNAAFLAADAGQPVSMAHVRSAAISEYAKNDKRPTAAEIGDWG